MNDEDWITAWEGYCGVAPRLTRFFASEAAQQLITECRQQQLHPEMFAFALIYLVWTAEAQKKLPDQDTLKEGVATFKKTVRWLTQHGGKGLPLQEVDRVISQLKQYAANLQRGNIPATVGHIAFGEASRSRRDRAKRRAVFFLTECARLQGIPQPPWAVITQFLVLCGLARQGTKPKTVGTWWSNCLARERSPEESSHSQKSELRKHQAGFYEWFTLTSQDVQHWHAQHHVVPSQN